MSGTGMSGGVVFMTGSTTTSRYGNQINIAATTVIPVGAWLIDVAWNLTTPDAVAHALPAGYCLSDGVNCATAATAGHLIPIGV